MPNLPAPCRHLHTDGRPCGSPALRGQPLCYHHQALRQPIPARALPDGQTVPQLPSPDDYLAIQRGIAEVLRLLANDEIPDRRAATLLRGLATASQNLARAHRHERHLAAQPNAVSPVTDLIVDPNLGNLALEQPVTKAQVCYSISGTPIQQNQYLTPLDENSPVPPEQPPTTTQQPAPAYLFTPHPTMPLADEQRFGELYMEMQIRARDQRQRFEAQKTAELEAHFQTRLEAALQTQPTPIQELALAS